MAIGHRAANDPLARFSALELLELCQLADDAASGAVSFAPTGHDCPECREAALQRRIASQREARAERRREVVRRTLAASQDSRQFLAAWLAARSDGSRREPAPW
jgi:hypothetical protein